MSGFYSKMLINIRNLYFNNSDDMKTILHGIFLDAADVFLNGYTPSYCEENELIPPYKSSLRSLVPPKPARQASQRKLLLLPCVIRQRSLL